MGQQAPSISLLLVLCLVLLQDLRVLTSQKFGAGRMNEMRKTVGNAAILSAVITIVLTAVSMLGMHWLLVFMNTPEDIFDGAYGYIMIICGGFLPRYCIIWWPAYSGLWGTAGHLCIS